MHDHDDRLGVSGQCAACDARGYLSIGWPLAAAERNSDVTFLASQLAPVRKLKFGQLYHCRICGKWWFLHEDSPTIERVPDAYRDLLMRWDAAQLLPDQPMLEALARIGATEADRYGNGCGEIKVPCAIYWKDGSISDPSIVVVAKHPPLTQRQNVKLFEHVSQIAQSDYTLPRSVRLACYAARELSNGFAPTPVETNTGERLILCWSVDIVRRGNIKGKDIRLVTQPAHFGADLPIVGQPLDEITYAYCDWFPGCQSLVDPLPVVVEAGTTSRISCPLTLRSAISTFKSFFKNVISGEG